jgi:hypothetical protein
MRPRIRSGASVSAEWTGCADIAQGATAIPRQLTAPTTWVSW